MAERVGFEPTVEFPPRSLSRRVLSTAQSPLRGRFFKISRAVRGAATAARDGPFESATSPALPSEAQNLAACCEKALQY